MEGEPEPKFYSWRAEPTVRGTSSILISCLVTLTLCVWTAVHLNIPAHGKASHTKWRKIAWLFMALFAPELVAFMAYCQWKEAKELGKHMREIYGQTETSWKTSLSSVMASFLSRIQTPPVIATPIDLENISGQGTQEDDFTGRHPWTSTHSFYALMGGFAIDTRTLERNCLPDNQQRMTLNSEGLRLFAQVDLALLPDLSEQEIQDKSKANNLAKTVVCFQAMWLCFQCFSRWYYKLPVSLLELNTFAHCLCALLIFCLWWNKPLDVEEPTLITGEQMEPMAALMAVCSIKSQTMKAYGYERVLCPSFRLAKADDPPPELETENRVTLHPGQAFRGFCFQSGGLYRSLTTDRFSLNRNDIHFWTLAGQALERYNLPGPSWPKDDMDRLLQGGSQHLLVERIGDFSKATKFREIRFIVGFTVAGLVYGALHLIAWNSPFRSHTEELLWKGSALVLASSPVFAFLLELFGLADAYMCALPRLLLPVLAVIVNGWAVIVNGWAALYILGRLYLVVECFLNISHLPEGAFQVPQWTQYIPHIN